MMMAPQNKPKAAPAKGAKRLSAKRFQLRGWRSSNCSALGVMMRPGPKSVSGVSVTGVSLMRIGPCQHQTDLLHISRFWTFFANDLAFIQDENTVAQLQNLVKLG